MKNKKTPAIMSGHKFKVYIATQISFIFFINNKISTTSAT